MEDDLTDDRPPNPFDYITQENIEDLWGIGYTLVKRAGGDPFHVPPEMIPATRSYQWWHLVHDKSHWDRGPESSWAPVSAARHDGYFMPFGHKGNIEILGLGLFEKSKVEVEQELASTAAAAHKQVQDWIEKAGAEFSGAVSVGGVKQVVGDEALAEKIDPDRDVFAISKSKTIETRVRIPKEMAPYMPAIFEERDRLKEEIVQPDRTLKPGAIADKFYAAVDADKAAPWWPTLHAILLPIAIENVRKQLTKETKP